MKQDIRKIYTTRNKSSCVETELKSKPKTSSEFF